MKKPILIIGDVMLDHYIEGHCDRISPEAPVPVVSLEFESWRLGGAANVAHNIHRLGEPCVLIGTIGRDEAGNRLRGELSAAGIPHHLFEEDIRTTVKSRVVSGSQQLLRVDSESIRPPREDTVAAIGDLVKRLQPAIIVVPDYGKGVVSDRLLEAVRHSAGGSAALLIDPSGTHWDKYFPCTVLKPNAREISAYLGKEDGPEAIEKLQALCKNRGIGHLVITRSSRGLDHITPEGTRQYPAEKVEVFDVTGAGDTVLAVIATLMSRGESMETLLEAAVRAGSYAVTKQKSYAISEEELARLRL